MLLFSYPTPRQLLTKKRNGNKTSKEERKHKKQGTIREPFLNLLKGNKSAVDIFEKMYELIKELNIGDEEFVEQEEQFLDEGSQFFFFFVFRKEFCLFHKVFSSFCCFSFQSRNRKQQTSLFLFFFSVLFSLFLASISHFC